MVKLRGVVGSGDCPNLVCKGSVAASKDTNSGITVSRFVWGREENTVALVASWGALCLHTAPTETYFPLKGRNFGNTSSSSPASLLVILCLYLCKFICDISLACSCACCCCCII